MAKSPVNKKTMDNFFSIFTRNNPQKDVEQRQFHERSACSEDEKQEQGGDIIQKILLVSNNDVAMKISAFNRGVSILCGSLSQMMMEYQKFNSKGEYFAQDVKSAYGRHINFLLQVKPNSKQNAAQFWKAVMFKIIMDGNAYILPKRSMIDGNVDELILINGSVNYSGGVYSITDLKNNINGNYAEKDIIHIRNSYVDDSLRKGIPTLTYAATALSICRTIDGQTLETSGKGGRLKLLLMRKPEDKSGIMGRVSAKEMKKQAENLGNNIFTNDVNFIDGDFDTVNVSMNAADQQLFENRKFGIPEIARFLGIPPVLLFDYSNSSYKSYEDSNIEFLCRSLAPVINEIETEFNAKLIDEYDFGKYQFEFSARKLMKMNEQSRADVNLKKLQTGTASVNELRRAENLPKIENGDAYYISTNLAEVGSDKLSANNIK